MGTKSRLLLVLFLFSLNTIVIAQRTENSPPQELLTSEEILNSYLESDKFKIHDNFEGITTKEFMIINGEYLIVSETQQIWNSTNWENQYLISYTYSTEGWLTEELFQVWNVSEWVPFIRSIYTYSLNGLRESQTLQQWNGINWEDAQREIYTYNLNNQIIEYLTQQWNGLDWENWYRTLRSYYPSGNLETGVFQNWNGSVWINSIRTSYLWNANNYIIEVLDEEWNVTGWENWAKSVYSYLPNNSILSKIRSYWSGTLWENNHQYLYTYDSNGNLIEYLKQVWNSVTGWINDYRYLNEYYLPSNTFFSDDLRSADIYQVWNVVQWQDSLRRSYSYNDQNLLEHLLSEISPNGTGWTNYHQSFYSYDSNGNYDIITSQSWNGSDWENYVVTMYNWLYIVPVELISFTAEVNENSVALSWITAIETNNKGFEVQRAISDGEFEAVGFVSGNGTTTEPMSYSFVDKNINSGSHQYRLKQIDFDGSFTYSDIIDIEVESPNVFSLEQNYPNPFNPTTKIKFTIPENVIATPLERKKQSQLVTLKVFDILGNEIATLVKEEKSAGSYEIEFTAESMPSGIYFYTLSTGKFFSTKKMILLK